MFRSLILLSLLFLSACSSFKSSPVLPLFAHLTNAGGQTEPTQFSPSFHYLRVALNDRVIFMASASPSAEIKNGVSVWYSADREVLRFQNGRLIAAVGLSQEWRSVTLPVLPEWQVLSKQTQSLKWTRIRDVMPGYHYELQDKLVLNRIETPSNSLLKKIEPNTLVWFEEQFESTEDAPHSLPKARYAVEIKDGHEQVIYAEQCIATELCFSWQHWPPQVKNSL